MSALGQNPYNPFNNINLTPQNTTSTRGDTFSESGVPANLSATIPTENGGTATEPSTFDIPTDAPPAYTPTADPSQGEAPLEFGPSRPFQRPPPQSSLTINTSASESSVSDQSHTRYPPPPRHPSVTSQSANATGPLLHQQQQTTYLPPPGPPPSRSLNRSESSNRPLSANNGSQDTGKPTTTPTPGRPLLKEGCLIVYPRGYECSKCHNTGYKSYDPSNPCRKCWQKYARPYTGALMYAPFSSGSNSSQTAGNLQRPLPPLRPPHSALPRPHSTSGYPGQNYRLSVPPQPCSPGSPRGYASPPVPPLQPQFHPPPGPPPQSQFHSPPGPPPMPFPHSAPASPAYAAAPPFPTPLILPPGDPRIGGRLCWRCDGKGRVSFLIFDSQICEVCGGIGRIFS